MVILILTAAGLTAKGWMASTHQVGTLQDPDFWFLLQSPFTQLAGMVPACAIPAHGTDMTRQPCLWAWTFVCIGVIVSFLAPSLYCVFPTEYLQCRAGLCGERDADAMMITKKPPKRSWNEDMEAGTLWKLD